MKTHKDLNVWKDGIAFVTTIYKCTESFPREELYSLTNQIRRSAVSIPSNIAEGAGRNTNKEYIRFLHVAQGSASELETQLIISKNLNFINEPIFSELINKLNGIRNQLASLIRYFNGRQVNK